MRRLTPWQTVVVILGLAFLLATLLMISGVSEWGQ